MKIHEKENIHLIALSPNISSLEDETTSPSEEELDFLHAVAMQAGQEFQSKYHRKQIFIISNDCQSMPQMLMKSLVYHFQSTESSEIDKQLSGFYFTTIFKNIME